MLNISYKKETNTPPITLKGKKGGKQYIENCVAKNNIEHQKRHQFETPGISGKKNIEKKPFNAHFAKPIKCKTNNFLA